MFRSRSSARLDSSYMELRGLQQELAVTQAKHQGTGTDPRPHARPRAGRSRDGEPGT